MTRRGTLIAFEGSDGSGKSTQAALLAGRLDAVLTRQAGGTPFGERIRTITLEWESAHLSQRTEALLYMADRAEHVDKVVNPALSEGRHVISDRWAYSSLVYQGYGRGLDIEELRHISDWAMKGRWPDVVILLDVPAEVGVQRRAARSINDHYEASGEALQSRVVEGYRTLAAADPERWSVVDGTGTVEDVAERIWKVVEPSLDDEE